MMKHNTQITLMVIAVLFVSIFITMAFTIYSINEKGQKDIEAYQEEHIQQVKQNLKDYVDIAYAMIESNDQNARLEYTILNLEENSYLEKYYGHRLESIIDLVEHILEQKAKLVKQSKWTRQYAQEQAKQEIKQFRYDNGKGYVWINDTGEPYPKMVMHPTAPHLDGQVLDNPVYEKVRGKNALLGDEVQDKNLFAAFVKVCKTKEKGYVGYIWPDPKNLNDEKPKLSYVRLFKEWNWVIGTGVYIDDAIEDGKTKTINDLKPIRFGEDKVGYFWINDTTKPTPRMIMHPTKPETDGTILDDQKYNTTLGKYTDVEEGKNLFETFAEVSEAHGSGYVDYKWPKPKKDGSTTEELYPKMSYVRLYKQLDWIVGSGAYLDDIEKGIKQREEAIQDQIDDLIYQVGRVFVIILILIMVILYFALKTSLPNKEE